MTLRIFLFARRSDAILIHADDEEVALPVLRAPFTLGDISKAISAAGIRCRIQECHPGRWTSTIRKAESDAKAERNSKLRTEEHKRATVMLGSSDATERERASLIVERQEAERSLAGITANIKDAKTAAYTHGEYMNPLQFRMLEADAVKLKGRISEIHVRLGEIKQARRQRADAERPAFFERFYKAAKNMLDEEEFAALVDEASGEPEE